MTSIMSIVIFIKKLKHIMIIKYNIILKQIYYKLQFLLIPGQID